MMMIAFIGLFAIGTVSGTVELFLHGGPFFVFRLRRHRRDAGDGKQEKSRTRPAGRTWCASPRHRTPSPGH